LRRAAPRGREHRRGSRRHQVVARQRTRSRARERRHQPGPCERGLPQARQGETRRHARQARRRAEERPDGPDPRQPLRDQAGRGVDGWTWDYTSADLFEVWADVARRFHLNPDWTSIAGYSMGGYSTYKLAVEYPDLFARAQPTVGPPGVGTWSGQGNPSGGAYTNTYQQLESLRNIPLLIYVAASDELVPYPGT